MNQFWNGIWGTPRSHASSTKWLDDLYVKHDALPEQPSVSISADDVTSQVKKMSNWKSPGFDQIHVFWVKKLTSIHHRLSVHFQTLLNKPELLPSWLVSF